MKRRAWRDARGASETVLVIFMFSMVLMAGFVADAGALFVGQREAQNAALAAARSGANQVDTDSLFQGDPVLDEGEALAAVADAVTASGHVLVSSSAGPVEVEVTVEKAVSMRFLNLIGISSFTVSGDAKAQLLSALETVNEP